MLDLEHGYRDAGITIHIQEERSVEVATETRQLIVLYDCRG